MKKLIVLLISIMFLTNSCIKDPPEAITKLIIEKETNHITHLSVYLNGQIVKEIILDANNSDTMTNNGGKGGSFFFYPFDIADSVRITFDNQYTTTHYKGTHPNNATRNIFELSNWEKIKEDKYYFEYKYLLQDNDYNEAVNNN
jgi:hypothetical protein